MNRLRITILGIILASFYPILAQEEEQKLNEKENDKIEVFYFHFTRRCATCNAVESESKKTLEALYPEKVKNELIVFHSLNLDDDSNKKIAKKLKVSGQALLIVKGEKQINLTNQGFMYARSKPARLRKIIKSEIDQIL